MMMKPAWIILISLCINQHGCKIQFLVLFVKEGTAKTKMPTAYKSHYATLKPRALTLVVGWRRQRNRGYGH